MENNVETILMILYESMVLPHLEYSAVLVCHVKKDIVGLERVQKKVARMARE